MTAKLLVLFLLAFGIAKDDARETKQLAVQAFNITCDHNSHRNCQGETLEKIAATIREQTDVRIDIKTPYLLLNANVTFANLNSLVINGEPSLTTINCVAVQSAGIVLNDIQKVTLNNLSLHFCGSVISRNVNNKTYSSALTIVHCKNIHITRLVIARSRGIGLTMLNYEDGEVSIKSAVFKENTQPKRYTMQSIMGGGGVYIVLSQQDLANQQFTLYKFDNCTFVNNSAHTNYHRLYRTLDNRGNRLEGYGQGGGISIVIERGIRNVHFSFMNCKYITNNAFFGGGFFASISGSSPLVTNNVSIAIRDSYFEGNGCDYDKKAAFGGGADLSFDTSSAKSTSGKIIDSHYLVKNVTFVNNCAIVGGGVYYFSDPETVPSSNNSIVFDTCTLQDNQAHLGSAIAMIPNRFLRLYKGYTTNPVFHNCQFFGNDIFPNHTHSHTHTYTIYTSYAGLGTIYADTYNIHFQGYNRFENNWGSAVYTTNGIVDFQNSSVDFVNNTGLQGGAVALIGSSVLFVGSNNYYNFINNTAIHEGGAIYVFMTNSAEFITPGSCFVQHGTNSSYPSNISVTFEGNKAKDRTAGHAIYATSIRPCQIVSDKTKTLKVINVSELLKGVKVDGLAETQVATDGATLRGSKSSPLMIIPGEKYEHGVILTDDLGQMVTDASFKVSVVIDKGDIQFDADSAVYVGNEIQLRGTRGSTATLYLQTTSPLKTYISLKVELLECPPGYSFNDKNLTCDCTADAYGGFLRCESYHSYLLPGYWAGQMETTKGPELVISSCAFCRYKNQTFNTAEIALPTNYSQLNLNICGDTRKGIVCGICQENYTVHFNSPSYQCKPSEPLGCKLGWLFYVLSEMVPITVIFISVLTFNIHLNSGAINGFIVFSQLLSSLDIDASGIITFPDSTVQKEINSWMQGHRVIYGFFTLNVFNAEFLSFCLWKNASALDMLAVKCFTILYILLLIAILVWMVNKCGGRCLGKCCRITTVKASVVHGISTFLMMCYTQCVKISLYLLTGVNFYVKANSNFKPPRRVWLNGEIVFFSKEHLPYALPAIFCILTIGVLPLALLLCYPLGNKVMDMLHLQDQKVVYYISQSVPIHVSSLKPLLDSIQSCYKDNLRFFAGLYFLYRWTIILTYVTAPSYGTYYIVVGSILICILILHSIFQPYINRAHNAVDTLLFANLLFINFLSFVNYYRSWHQKAHHGSTIVPTIVQLVLIYTPLVVMGACLLVFSCRGALMRGCKGQCIDDQKKLRNLVRYLSTKEGSLSDEEELPYRLLHENYRK